MKKSVVVMFMISLLMFAVGQTEGIELTVQMQDHSATRAIQKRLPDFEKETGINPDFHCH
jgi:hypothetical protein